MTEALIAYALFLAETFTLLVLIGGLLAVVIRALRETPAARPEHLEITDLNDRYRETARALKHATLPAKVLRKAVRAETKEDKARDKAGEGPRRRLYVIDFHGDIRASGVAALRECITAVLLAEGPGDDEGRDARGRATQGAVADEGRDARGRATQGAVADEGRDARGRATQGAVAEVLVRLENAGGLVAEHGLAASQLARIRARQIRLTVAVDKVAASGGYLMACVGDRILAAPFAILGSIGVVAQLPNFHRVLERHGVDFELHTAGKHKRTLTLFGENTEAGREKLREQIEDTHRLFKEALIIIPSKTERFAW